MTSSKSMSSVVLYVPFLTLCVLDVAGRIALIVGLLSFLSSSSMVTWAITGCEGAFPLYGFDATTAKFHFGFDRRLSRSNVRLVHIWPVVSSKLNGNESSGCAWLMEYLKRTCYKFIQFVRMKPMPRSIFRAHPNLKSIMHRNANSKSTYCIALFSLSRSSSIAVTCPTRTWLSTCVNVSSNGNV